MFGERLKLLRSNIGITQADFAEKFEISRGTIAMWETNKRQPDHDTLLKIADFFQVTVDYLLGRTDAPNLAIPKEMEGIGVAFSSGISMDGLNADQIEDVMNYIDYIKNKKKN